jgi:hypothetical protein
LTPDDWMKINQINIIDPDHAVSIWSVIILNASIFFNSQGLRHLVD